jgi:hypothetical protein
MRLREVRDESSLWGDLRPELAGAVSVILHATTEDELAAMLAARPFERSLDRSGYRFRTHDPVRRCATGAACVEPSH